MEHWFYSISPEEKERRKQEVRRAAGILTAKSRTVPCAGEETVHGGGQERRWEADQRGVETGA